MFCRCQELIGRIGAELDEKRSIKGGIAINVSARLRVPVQYVGVGEKADDLVDIIGAVFEKGVVAGDEVSIKHYEVDVWLGI